MGYEVSSSLRTRVRLCCPNKDLAPFSLHKRGGSRFLPLAITNHADRESNDM